ncbi:MAG TPA: sensor histidine kinase [Terracidiphilus sp.]|jgi:signal transduction histidine kinase|nr:sensor histidine kinase [Terracidiphilus sp.]
MQAAEIRANPGEAERRRVEAVVETMAGMRRRTGTLTEVAHDARNMVTALALYCDLLAEPGVLQDGFAHYAHELRLVTSASRRLVEKLMQLDGSGIEEPEARPVGWPGMPGHGPESSGRNITRAERLPNDPIDNLQEELLANRNLLDAMAGLAIAVAVRTEGGARPVRLSSEDLTRVLVNLVKNASEAMGRAGAIEITLRELPDPQGGAPAVVLAVEDTGPGIAEESLARVFEPGYSSHAVAGDRSQGGGWPAAHRGLGLSITRSIVESAGGRVRAANRDQGGARLEIELPIRTR